MATYYLYGVKWLPKFLKTTYYLYRANMATKPPEDNLLFVWANMAKIPEDNLLFV